MSLPQENWLPSPETLRLSSGGEAHVWRIFLNRDSSSSLKLLSAAERHRADKYRFTKDRANYIAARAALRKILSRYLDVPPNEIGFSDNRFGKPALSLKTSEDWRFNVSRSGEIALCAVTRGREIGLDIEFINEDSANAEIAGRFFSPIEISSLKDIPENRQNAAFFSCWTRKEAFVKAVGRGLSYPLHEFSVSVVPEESAPSITVHDNGASNRWFLRSFSPHPDYAAAVAVEGAMPTLRFLQWT